MTRSAIPGYSESSVSVLKGVLKGAEGERRAAYSMCWVTLAVRSDDLNNAHLKRLVQAWNWIVDAQDIFHRFLHWTVREKDERVPFTRRISFGNEECVHELWCIWYEMYKFAIDGVNREDSILAYVRVSMLKTWSTSGDERFKEFHVFRNFLEES